MKTTEAIEIIERLRPTSEYAFQENFAIDMAINALNFLKDYKDSDIYQVWLEGYAATGESGTAQLLGVAHAENFIEAAKKTWRERCIKGGHDEKYADNYFSIRDGIPSIWGCACFDNEADARKRFG